MDYFKPSRPVPIVQYSWSFSEVEFRWWVLRAEIRDQFVLPLQTVTSDTAIPLKADGISCFEEAIGDLERGRATTCPGWNVLWTIQLFSKIHNVGEVVQRFLNSGTALCLFFPWCLHLSSSKKGENHYNESKSWNSLNDNFLTLSVLCHYQFGIRFHIWANDWNRCPFTKTPLK